MVRPDDQSTYSAVDQYGIHEFRGPLMVGGVEFLSPSTGLFRDIILRRKLSSDQRFEAYLKFRDEAFKIVATQLVAAFNSPVDLFLFTHEDEQLFVSLNRSAPTCCDPAEDCFLSDSIFVDDQNNGNEVDNISATTFLNLSDQSTHNHDYNDEKESLLRSLRYTQRYFVYRKSLMKLDFSQFNNDLEKALEWLKSSTGWSQLHEDELRCGLKSHLDMLKKPKPESIYLARINFELASELEKKLETSDWALMGHYYNRMKLWNLARECSIQSQAAGVILVQQALPTRKIYMESRNSDVLKFHSAKQTVKLSLEGSWASLRQILKELGRTGEKFGSGVAGRVALLALIPVAFGTVGMSNRRK